MNSLLRAVLTVALAAAVVTVGAQGPVDGVFFNETWESGSLSNSFNSSGYGRAASNSQYRAQNAIAASGTWAFQHMLTQGMTPGDVAFTTQHIGDAVTGPVYPTGAGQHFYDLYVQYKVYYTPGFDFRGYKQFIIGTQDDRRHDNSCCNPWVAHYLTIYPARPEYGTVLAEANNKQAASGQWVGFRQNAGGYGPSNLFSIQTGRWYTIEVRRRLNDSGVDNGIFQLWIDGQIISDNRSVRFRTPWNGSFGSNFTHGTNFVMISDYTSSNVTQNQSIYYDDVKFSTTYIGVQSSTPPAPPAPPTNLRIIS
jgi:hypothetical protein